MHSVLHVFLLAAATALLSAEAKPLLPEQLFKIAIPETKRAKEYRLPGTTVPSMYKITLQINPNAEEGFEGSVKIDVKAIQETDTIVLHSHTIDIHNITVLTKDTENIFNSSVTANDDTHFLTIKLNKRLVKDQSVEINISYKGHWGKNMHGLYLSSYEENKKIRNLATTQFEPTNAREAFPCYDEPGLKAVFQVVIDCPVGFSAISNTDVMKGEGKSVFGDDFHSFKFAQTPRMSTYLIAFVVSDFNFKSNTLHGPQTFPKEVRSYARPSANDDLAFSLKISQDSLKWLQSFTKVNYPISKMDNVAVPDFSAGAMENWGLVTYREEYLLQKDGTTTTKNVMNIATIISHENAHQWFGNEVSPLWWEYLWLSEGFATYFEYHTTDKILEGWKLSDQFVTNQVHLALRTDGLVDTNAMSNSVATPSEINNQFNRIAYQKAGSVIRMIEHIMGSHYFQEGLTNYLTQIPLGSGEPKILFSGLDKAISGKDVLPKNITITQIFSSWADQKGFPLLTATRNANGRIDLKQNRYHQNNSMSSNEAWLVPINVAKESDPSFDVTKPTSWLLPNMSSNIDVGAVDKWFILNKQQTGYYRVMYDDSNWKLLAKALNTSDHGKIHLLNRAQLVDDIFEFARTSRLSYNITFELISYLAQEVEYVPWVAANNGITFLSARMQGTENYDRLQAFVQQLNKKVYTQVSFQVSSADTPITKLNRIQALSIACAMGSKDCHTKAGDLLKEQMNSKEVKMVDPDLRQVVYCSAVRAEKTNVEWEYLLDQLMKASLAPEVTLLLNALGCTQDPELIKRYLKYSIEGTQVRDQDRHLVVESVVNAGEKGLPLALDFVKTNFKTLQQKLTSLTGTSRIIAALGNRLVTAEDFTKFQAFVAEYSSIFTAAEKASANMALETARSNRDWLLNTIDDVDSWLLDNVTLGATSNVVSFTLLAFCLFVVRYFTQ